MFRDIRKDVWTVHSLWRPHVRDEPIAIRAIFDVTSLVRPLAFSSGSGVNANDSVTWHTHPSSDLHLSAPSVINSYCVYLYLMDVFRVGVL